MKQFFLFFFISFFSLNVNAEWKHMHIDKKFDNWYLDFAKIHRINDHVFYQTLVDHNDNKLFPSSITHNQGDCVTFEWKITHISLFKENMAEQYLSTKKTNHTFQKIEKDSILGYLLNIVCKNSYKENEKNK